MKKVLLSLVVMLLLCGCGNIEAAEVVKTSEETTETQPACYVEISHLTRYETLEEFKASDFYAGISEKGYTPYLLEYDEQRYRLSMITSDADFYVFHFYDNVNEQDVRYSISYNSGLEDMEDVQRIFYCEKSVLTTAEKNGVTYSVYLNTSPYDEIENYSLIYLPFADYKVSIHDDSISTPEEILSYFDDFELVADN